MVFQSKPATAAPFYRTVCRLAEATISEPITLLQITCGVSLTRPRIARL
jgi:hypothetical protein